LFEPTLGFSAEKIIKENSMKTNNYKFGKHTCKTYFRPAATGFEVGFCFGPGKPIFVGNFISRAEANKWWATLNRREQLKKRQVRKGLLVADHQKNPLRNTRLSLFAFIQIL